MEEAEFDMLLTGITFADVLRAVADLNEGTDHDFREPRNRDVVIAGRLFGVRPLIALAVRRQRQGQQLGTGDFHGGRDTRSARALAELGFSIEQREIEKQA
jgi:hypothetical protein